MIITSIETHKVTIEDKDILKFLDKYIQGLEENSVLAITSKVVAICEGSVVAAGEIDKDKLIESESQYYLPRQENPYNVALTITENNLIASAGIDESNGNGFYILWPKNPQQTANEIRAHFRKKFKLKNLGVIITDSRTTPLRWGITAIAIGYSGIKPLKNYIGKPDIFGRNLLFTKMSIIDNLASAAALVMGEGNEQTPLAVAADLPQVEFVDENPTKQELKDLKITMEEDIYAPLLKNAPWKKGSKF